MTNRIHVKNVTYQPTEWSEVKRSLDFYRALRNRLNNSRGEIGLKNPYRQLGIVLVLLGAISAPVFYFVVGSVPIAAVAISAIILGLVSAMLGNARPEISPEASQMMLTTGMENLAALLEELGLRSKAIYFPSSSNDTRPRALIPLNEDSTLPNIGKVSTDRLIARYGSNLEDMCLVATTPGTVCLDSAEIVPGGGPGEIEVTLNNLMVGIMDLADSVSVRAEEDRIIVEVVKPKLNYENIWFYRCLGSPTASIVATVASQTLVKPVRVSSEEEIKKGTRIEIEVLP